MGTKVLNKTGSLLLSLNRTLKISFTLSQAQQTFNGKFIQIVLSVCCEFCYGQRPYLFNLRLCRYVHCFLA